tara:strand:+ start:5290 stop:5430 length:141 start_codon:yes stop_codon:yes gene_type:complete
MAQFNIDGIPDELRDKAMAKGLAVLDLDEGTFDISYEDFIKLVMCL